VETTGWPIWRGSANDLSRLKWMNSDQHCFSGGFYGVGVTRVCSKGPAAAPHHDTPNESPADRFQAPRVSATSRHPMACGTYG